MVYVCGGLRIWRGTLRRSLTAIHSDTSTVTCIWSDSWRFRWPYSERTAGCPSSHTGTPYRSEGTTTPCLSSVGSAVVGPPSGVKSPSQPRLAKGNCRKVSNFDIIILCWAIWIVPSLLVLNKSFHQFFVKVAKYVLVTKLQIHSHEVGTAAVFVLFFCL